MQVINIAEYAVKKADTQMLEQLVSIEEKIDYVLSFYYLLGEDKEKEAIDYISNLALLENKVKCERKKVQDILKQIGEFK